MTFQNYLVARFIFTQIFRDFVKSMLYEAVWEVVP